MLCNLRLLCSRIICRLRAGHTRRSTNFRVCCWIYDHGRLSGQRVLGGVHGRRDVLRALGPQDALHPLTCALQTQARPLLSHMLIWPRPSIPDDFTLARTSGWP